MLPQQEEKAEEFFPLLHYVMTIGALVAALGVPFLRLVPCYDLEFCYPLAFGVSSLFIILSFGNFNIDVTDQEFINFFFKSVIFFAGSNHFTIKPNEGKFVRRVFKCIRVS